MSSKRKRLEITPAIINDRNEEDLHVVIKKTYGREIKIGR